MCLQVRLEWPTDLAINPLDNSLYILDNNIVLQVDTETSQEMHYSYHYPSSMYCIHYVYVWFKDVLGMNKQCF